MVNYKALIEIAYFGARGDKDAERLIKDLHLSDDEKALYHAQVRIEYSNLQRQPNGHLSSRN